MSITVSVAVPGSTSNLGPGFDCLGAALGLVNRFELQAVDGGAEQFELTVTGDTEITGGTDNLICRAAHRAWQEIGVKPVGLRTRLELGVPPARGLGSSGTAIVAGLIGANALAGEPLSTEKLLELAIDMEGHPDNVVPSLLGGACLTARVQGQRWRVLRCEWHEGVQAVVAIPSIRLSTAEARRAMPRNIPVRHAVSNLGALTLLLQGLRTGNGDLIADGLHDSIHEPYRWGLIQGGRAVREAALEAGAWGCVISGAGPSLLALAPPEHASAVAAAMVAAWEREGVSSRGEVLPLREQGATWELL